MTGKVISDYMRDDKELLTYKFETPEKSTIQETNADGRTTICIQQTHTKIQTISPNRPKCKNAKLVATAQNILKITT